jgi:hypothetical protein
MAAQTPAQTFDLAALGGVVEPQKQEFNLAALGGVVEPEPQRQDSTLARGAKAVARGTKSLGSGVVGGTADLISMPYNLAATMFNALKESKFAKDLDPASRAMLEAEGFYLGESGSPDIPTAPSAVDAVDHGVDMLTGDYTKTPDDEKSIHEGLKAMGSMASIGGVAKSTVKFGANKIGNALEKFGSTKARDLAAGGIASWVTSKAMENKHGLPAAFGEGIGAGALANVLLHPKNALKSAAKVGLAAGGLGKKNFKTEAYEKLRNIGAEPTAAALSDSATTAQLHQLGSFFPVLGEKIIAKNQKISKVIEKGINNLAAEIGSAGDQEARIKQLYDLAQRVLPAEAQLAPTNLVKQAKTLLEKELKLGTPKDDLVRQLKGIVKKFSHEGVSEEKAIANFLHKNPGYDKMIQNPELKAKILEEYKKIRPIEGIPSINTLIDQKVRLNDVIDWQGADPERKLLVEALREDIRSYKNPEFQQKFKEAETLFGQVAERKEFERTLRNAITDPITQEPNHASLTRIVLGEGAARDKLKEVKGLDFEKLEKFVEASRTMAQAQKNIKNPSGSGVFLTLIKFVTSLAEDSVSTLFNKGVGIVGLDQLLTNKRFLNLGYRFAKNPTETHALQFNNLIKENTGMTAQALVTGLKGNGDAEKKKLKFRMYNPDNPPKLKTITGALG